MGNLRQQSARGEGGSQQAGRDNPERASLYQEVTDRIIAELEQGRVPWVQPWGGARAELGLPRNAATRRSYSGINILVLWGAVIERGFASQQWLTFRQALALGGNVRKDERGTTVFYADSFIPKSEAERAAQEGSEPEAVPFLKRFTVFNVAQCEGLPEQDERDSAPMPECEIIPRAEALIAATGADFRIGGNRAFYVPNSDYIQVPPQPAFFDQINYYRTCFHELGHWTGHPSRLDRKLVSRFGSTGYAREELFAELASAFICATLGIVPTVRHTDYLASWLEVLREDNRAIFRAASQASKAAEFILGFESSVPPVGTVEAPASSPSPLPSPSPVSAASASALTVTKAAHETMPLHAGLDIAFDITQFRPSGGCSRHSGATRLRPPSWKDYRTERVHPQEAQGVK